MPTNKQVQFNDTPSYDTDNIKRKPDWLSVKDDTFEPEVTQYFAQYTATYTHGYTLLNEAVRWLEYMRKFAIMYSPGTSDPAKHVDYQVAYDLHHICKYELPAPHEIYMVTLTGRVIDANFFTENARIARKKSLETMYAHLQLANAVLVAWCTDYLKTSTHEDTSGKQQKESDLLKQCYPVYKENMKDALEFLKKYLSPGGVGTLRCINPKNPLFQYPKTDETHFELCNLLARLTRMDMKCRQSPNKAWIPQNQTQLTPDLSISVYDGWC